MSGLSLGAPPAMGYGPPSNTGLPQSNFPTRSLAAGPPGQSLGPPGQVTSQAPPTGLPTSSRQQPPGLMTGPPTGMPLGPPGGVQARAPGPITAGRPGIITPCISDLTYYYFLL